MSVVEGPDRFYDPNARAEVLQEQNICEMNEEQ